MKMLAPLLALFVLAAPAVASAQDSSFESVDLEILDSGKVTRLIVRDGALRFASAPREEVEASLTEEQRTKLAASVKGFVEAGAPTTEIDARPGAATFELTVKKADGTRWHATGPVEHSRGGPLPAVYHVVKDVQELQKAAQQTAPLVELRFKDGRGVTVNADGKSVDVTVPKGTFFTTFHVTKPELVAKVLDALKVGRLAATAGDADVGLENSYLASQTDKFTLTVRGDGGERRIAGPTNLAGPIHSSYWRNAEWRASAGPVVDALADIVRIVDAQHQLARALAPQNGPSDKVRGSITKYMSDPEHLGQWTSAAEKSLAPAAKPVATTGAPGAEREVSRTPGMAETLGSRAASDAERTRRAAGR